MRELQASALPRPNLTFILLLFSSRPLSACINTQDRCDECRPSTFASQQLGGSPFATQVHPTWPVCPSSLFVFLPAVHLFHHHSQLSLALASSALSLHPFPDPSHPSTQQGKNSFINRGRSNQSIVIKVGSLVRNPSEETPYCCCLFFSSHRQPPDRQKPKSQWGLFCWSCFQPPSKPAPN